MAGPSPDKERNQKIAELVRQGHLMQKVGDMYGISRQRVQQIALREGVRSTIRDKRAQVRADREAADLQQRRSTCRVCGAEYVKRHSNSTCGSDACRTILTDGRRYLDPKRFEAQRMNQAKYWAANSDDPALKAWSEAMLKEYRPPNRRYTVPGSRISELLRQVGRDDLLP